MSNLITFFSNLRTQKNTSTSSRSCQSPHLILQSSSSSIMSFDSDDSISPLSPQRNDNGTILAIFVFI